MSVSGRIPATSGSVMMASERSCFQEQHIVILRVILRSGERYLVTSSRARAPPRPESLPSHLPTHGGETSPLVGHAICVSGELGLHLYDLRHMDAGETVTPQPELQEE